METLRLEVCHRSILLDQRPFIFITEGGEHVEETTTRGVVERIERYVRRKLRGKARDYGLAQILGSLRQFNSPKEGYSQFVVVEPSQVERLGSLEGQKHQCCAGSGRGGERFRLLLPSWREGPGGSW